MTAAEIAKHRLVNQGIVEPKQTTPKDVVAWLGAVQAQDYAMAKWAVGVRSPEVTDDVVEDALDKGEIIRTHILRPTWHLVSADDIRWMLALSAPTVKASMGAMFRRVGLDDKVLKRTNALIEKALVGGNHLTRKELMAELQKKGFNTDELRSTLIMFGAELAGVVCNGPRRGKQSTYALLDERVPQSNGISREEAAARLALRYFTSHGPATVRDFAWWSGLRMADIRGGIEEVKGSLLNKTIGDETYWFPDAESGQKRTVRTVRFLPAFDEFMVSYKDRTASLDPAFTRSTITGNGIFKPIIVRNGKVIGIWKRTPAKGKVRIETFFFEASETLSRKEMDPATKEFGRFVGMDAEVL